MTDAELIARLRRTPGWPTLGKLAANRLTQLSEENARAQEDIANLTASLAAEVTESERIRAALAQGQKEGA